MGFKEWLKLREEGTFSNSVAIVPNIVGYSTRPSLPMITFCKGKKKKKKKKKS
jgi:hypothetical protein